MYTAVRFLFPLALLQPAAYGEPLSIERLKTVYLACNEASERGELGLGEIMHCSVVYEELKRRAFDGDFERLLAWSRSTAPRGRPTARESIAVKKN